MGWKRIGNHRYFYRSVRVGDRVRSEYVGRGPGAEAVAALWAVDRAEAEADRVAERARREADRVADRELDRLVSEARAMAEETIKAAGFHNHRGQWRRCRDASA